MRFKSVPVPEHLVHIELVRVNFVLVHIKSNDPLLILQRTTGILQHRLDKRVSMLGLYLDGHQQSIHMITRPDCNLDGKY